MLGNLMQIAGRLPEILQVVENSKFTQEIAVFWCTADSMRRWRTFRPLNPEGRQTGGIVAPKRSCQQKANGWEPKYRNFKV